MADHTDDGPGGDSQKPVMNDNVLYHSLPELANRKMFGTDPKWQNGDHTVCRSFPREIHD
jgi:hypothetical protein